MCTHSHKIKHNAIKTHTKKIKKLKKRETEIQSNAAPGLMRVSCWTETLRQLPQTAGDDEFLLRFLINVPPSPVKGVGKWLRLPSLRPPFQQSLLVSSGARVRHHQLRSRNPSLRGRGCTSDYRLMTLHCQYLLLNFNQ